MNVGSVYPALIESAWKDFVAHVAVRILHLRRKALSSPAIWGTGARVAIDFQQFNFLVHGQVTIIFVVSVGLSVCFFV